MGVEVVKQIDTKDGVEDNLQESFNGHFNGDKGECHVTPVGILISLSLFSE